MKKLLAVLLICATASAQAGPFVSGQVLTAAQLNSVVDSKTTNAAAAITAGTIAGVTIDNSVVGGTTPASVYMPNSVSVIAAGTTQGTATALTSQFNKVVTASGTAYGVVLPTPLRSGFSLLVENATNYFVSVYPPLTGTIDTLTANTPIILPPQGTVQLVSSSTLSWDSYDSTNGVFSTVSSTQSSATAYNMTYSNYVANAAGAQVKLLHDRGTPAATSAILANDNLGNFDFWGSNGTAQVEGALLTVGASANWTGTSNDTLLNVLLTPTGSTTPATAAQITPHGTGIGAVANAAYGLTVVAGSGLTGTAQVGTQTTVTGTSAATASIYGVSSVAQTAAAAYTSASVASFYAGSSVAGATSTITSNYGFYSADQTAGASNYGFYSAVTAGASKFAFYNGGNATVQLGTGSTYIGTITNTSTGFPIYVNTAPTISSGFGTTPSIANANGTAAFRVNVGTGGTAASGVIGLPTATNGWNCYAQDITTFSTTVFVTRVTASTTTTVTIGNFNSSAVSAAWAASDIIQVSCFAY